MKNNHTIGVNSSALGFRMLVGGFIGLCLIGFFLLTAGEPNPEWPSYWRARPLIIVTVAGATGGAVFYFLHYLIKPAGWKKVLVNILGALIFVIGLWMGSVLGLVGTYWH